MTKFKKVRIDLFIFALFIELVWSYCFYQWTSLVINSFRFEPWELFGSMWSYFVVAGFYYIFAFSEYLILFVMNRAIKGKPLLSFDFQIHLKGK